MTVAVARRASPRHARPAPGPRLITLAILLSGQTVRLLPWVPLLAGCLAGLGVSVVTLLSARLQAPDLLLTAMRAGFLPVLAALAFLPHDQHRQLLAAVPAPDWLTALLRVVLAAPALALTCWLQLVLADRALRQITPGPGSHPVVPGLAVATEFAACCLLTLAVATVVERGRWQDLGGAVAMPGALILLAGLAASPLRLLPTSFVPMTGPGWHEWLRAWLVWTGLGASAAVLTCWSSRDPWRRFRPRTR
jgi:hypothetical protein